MNDYSKEYNTTTRVVLRKIQIAIFLLYIPLTMLFFDQFPYIAAIIPMFGVFFSLLTFSTRQCPNCGAFVGKKVKKHFLLMPGFLPKDGKCWNCGVILKHRPSK